MRLKDYTLLNGLVLTNRFRIFGMMMTHNHVPYILLQERNHMKEGLSILNMLESLNEILLKDYPTKTILKSRRRLNTKSIG